MLDTSTIYITPEILNLIAEIDEFKGSWQLLGRMAPERLKILRTVATIESIGSSTRIEGSQLSDREVEKLLLNIEKASFISRDEQEVAGYAKVCNEIFEGFEAISLSENVIKQLHAWLLEYSTKDIRHRGEYKKISNNVEAFNSEGKSLGVIFETTSPFDTPLKMQELIFWTKEQLQTKSLHPLLIIGIFTVVFLAIHPFQDGNGRLSRILTTLLLLQCGYAYAPYSSLESIIERNKESYYLALRKTQSSLRSSKPDYGPWLTFFIRALQKQKKHLEQKVLREKTFTLHQSEIEQKIMMLIVDHGRLTMGDAQRLTQANRSTLKKHMANLVRMKAIAQFGKGKGTWYALP